MPKRKDIARFAKDVDNGAKVVTGHGLGYFGRMLWDLKGKKVVEDFLRGGVKPDPLPEAEDWRYSVLGVEPDVSSQVLKVAWLKRNWETHPDKGGDEAANKLVNQAYDEIKKERGIK